MGAAFHLTARGANSIDLSPLKSEADIEAVLQNPETRGMVLRGDVAGIERTTGMQSLIRALHFLYMLNCCFQESQPMRNA